MARAKRPAAWDTIPGLSEESKRWIADIQKETDRGVAMVAAAFFDDVLGAMIRARLVDDPKKVKKLLKYPGPLSSFAARIDMSYLLGLLGPKIRKALHAVRDVRNQFAHSHVPVTFEDAQVRQLCEKLDVYPRNILSFEMDTRNWFILHSALMGNVLLMRGMKLTHFEATEDPHQAHFVGVAPGTVGTGGDCD